MLQMDDKFIDDALTHLATAIGLSQIPRDGWTKEDARLMTEAREFLQHHLKGKDESGSAEGSRGEAVATPNEQEDETNS